MDAKRLDLAQLIQGWEKLALGVRKYQVLNFGEFDPIFAQTHSLLSQHSAESGLSKAYIPLVANAFLFAKSDTKNLDSKCHAALILTERMLSCYAFGTLPVQSDRVIVYSMEARKDVCIDFTEIAASIDVLAEILEAQNRIAI